MAAKNQPKSAQNFFARIAPKKISYMPTYMCSLWICVYFLGVTYVAGVIGGHNGVKINDFWPITTGSPDLAKNAQYCQDGMC